MSEQSVGMKSYEEKVRAQLQEAKSKIEEIEARAKGKMAQAEVDAINGLKVKKQELDKKRHELTTSGEAKAAQIKAEIEADMAKFKASVDQLSTKVKSHAANK